MRREKTDYCMAGTTSGQSSAIRSIARTSARTQPQARIPTAEDRSAVDLVDVLAAAVQHHAPAARRRGIRLAARTGSARHVDGDPLVLFAVVEGLIANALARSNNRSTVICALQAENGAVVLSVADEGPELHGSDLARMLWPHTLPAQSTRAHDGRLDDGWLGVASRLHGSRVEGRNRGPGAGSVMSLHLPVAIS